MPDTLDNLKRAVEAMHGVMATHEGASRVHEMMDGKTVWDGLVDTFSITGHAKATKAFAWAYRDAQGEVQYIAVLNVPPLLTPREAVQAAIASGRMA